MVTAFGTIASDATSAIAAVIPVVLPIMGIVVVVGIGVSIFKRFVM